MTKSEVIKNLTTLRDQIAKKTGLENYKILKYETIELIASSMPETLEDLLKVKGIGQKKLEQYGNLILETIHHNRPRKNATHLRGKQSTIDIRQSNKGVGIVKKNENKSIGKVLSVGAFLDLINDVLGEAFEDLYVQGEISSLNEHPSGIYLTLKDQEDDSVLNCYLPPGICHQLGTGLEEGMMIKAGGIPKIWKPKGKFSLTISELELVGVGSLKKAYELLKKKLAKEGLFERKRELKEYIDNVGVITSHTGAVINDFCNNLSPLGIKINFFDTRVEGAQAVNGIREGIKWFNKNMPDLDALIIIRGGGSLEDLQAFNNELVARDIFASKIPTIVGIGHDRDVPIASLVSDKAVSTPTAAANLINESWSRVLSDLPQFQQIIINVFENGLERIKMTLENFSEKMVNSFDQALVYAKENLISKKKYLSSVNPERQLKLGYSIVTNKKGKIIKSVNDIKVNEEVETRIAKGRFKSIVNKLN